MGSLGYLYAADVDGAGSEVGGVPEIVCGATFRGGLGVEGREAGGGFFTVDMKVQGWPSIGK